MFLLPHSYLCHCTCWEIPYRGPTERFPPSRISEPRSSEVLGKDLGDGLQLALFLWPAG